MKLLPLLEGSLSAKRKTSKILDKAFTANNETDNLFFQTLL